MDKVIQYLLKQVPQELHPRYYAWVANRTEPLSELFRSAEISVEAEEAIEILQYVTEELEVLTDKAKRYDAIQNTLIP